MIKKGLLVVALSATLAVSIVGCGAKTAKKENATTTEAKETTAKEDKNPLVGTYWLNEEIGIAYYFKDATAVEMKMDGYLVSDNYQIKDGVLTSGDEEIEYSINGDKLTFVSELGDIVFKKITAKEYEAIEAIEEDETEDDTESDIDVTTEANTAGAYDTAIIGYWVNMDIGEGYHFLENGTVEKITQGILEESTYSTEDAILSYSFEDKAALSSYVIEDEELGIYQGNFEYLYYEKATEKMFRSLLTKDEVPTEDETEEATKEKNTEATSVVVSGDIDPEIIGYWINTDWSIGYHFTKDGVIEAYEGNDEMLSETFSTSNGNIILGGSELPYSISNNELTIKSEIMDITFSKSDKAGFESMAE